MEYSSLCGSLSAAIQLYRQKRNLSAEECARELGVSKTALLNIERRVANPTLETVEIIARNMGADPLDLLGYRGTTDIMSSLLIMSVLTQKQDFLNLDTLPRALEHIQAAASLLEMLIRELNLTASRQKEPPVPGKSLN